MLNGTATPTRLKRPNLTRGALTYELPGGLGAFFTSCWNGKETRHHHLENGICPNCQRNSDSGRLVSLHAIAQRGQWTTALVVVLEHKWTFMLAEAMADRSFLVRPLRITLGPGEKLSVSVTSDQAAAAKDVYRSSERIVSVWNYYFRGNLTLPASIMNSGTDWIR